jgi:hypothetical protein
MKDLKSLLGLGQLLPAQSISATTKTKYVDMANYNSVAFLVNAGQLDTTGTYTITIQESATTADTAFADIAAGDYIGGAVPSIVLENASGKENVSQLIGYKRSDNSKRYVRVALTLAGSANALVSVDALVAQGITEPAATPTVGTAV